MKEVGFEPTQDENPTDLQSATINHSVTPSLDLRTRL